MEKVFSNVADFGKARVEFAETYEADERCCRELDIVGMPELGFDSGSNSTASNDRANDATKSDGSKAAARRRLGCVRSQKHAVCGSGGEGSWIEILGWPVPRFKVALGRACGKNGRNQVAQTYGASTD